MPKKNPLWQRLAALVLFGVSFGYVEAAVVVYLREVYEPFALEWNPERRPGELFPLTTLEQLQAADTVHLKLLKTEVIREAATILMLASVGLAVGWNFRTRFAGFVVAFGIWDVFFYVFLKAIINWPSSLLEWDLLFLIPLPWVGPVLAPVLVAISMIALGTVLLWRESVDRPLPIGWRHWSIIVLGGLIIIAAFCWDSHRIMDGELPRGFPWSTFLVGELAGVAGFLLALISSDRRSAPAA